MRGKHIGARLRKRHACLAARGGHATFQRHKAFRRGVTDLCARNRTGDSVEVAIVAAVVQRDVERLVRADALRRHIKRRDQVGVVRRILIRIHIERIIRLNRNARNHIGRSRAIAQEARAFRGNAPQLADPTRCRNGEVIGAVLGVCLVRGNHGLVVRDLAVNVQILGHNGKRCCHGILSGSAQNA